MTAETLVSQTQTTKRVVFTGPLNIYDAGLVKAELSAALEQVEEGGLELDVSQVTEIDLAGLQLLLLAQRECLRAQHCLRIVGATDAIHEAISFCNLGAFFGQALVPSTER